MNSKIDTAFEVSSLVVDHTLSIKNFAQRMDRVETDMQVVKVALGRLKK